MELKFLNKDEIVKAGINVEQAIEKNLIFGDNYDLYIKVQSLYKKIFDFYIENTLDIKKIDRILEKSELDYGKIDENSKNLYHKFSYLDSNYLFVRNFFYVERLNNDYINKFIDKVNAGEFDIDNELMNIVKFTYKDVMMVKSKRVSGTFKTLYGESNPKLIFDNDSLVIFINYGKNKKELKGREFIENKNDKEKYLSELIKKLKVEFEQKLNCKVELQYFKGVI